MQYEVRYDKEKGIVKTPLNSPPSPLENRWAQCSAEQMRVFLNLSSPANQENYSEEALRRLRQFESEVIIRK